MVGVVGSFLRPGDSFAAIAAAENRADKLMLTGREQTLRSGADSCYVHSAKNFKGLSRQVHLFFAVWLMSHVGAPFRFTS